MSNAAQALLANDPASKLLDIKLITKDDESCQLQMAVSSNMTNGYQICHGGFVFMLADTACAFASAQIGETIVSASNQIDYLAAAKLADCLTAEAKVFQKTNRHVFCDVSVKNQNSELIAVMHSKLARKAK